MLLESSKTPHGSEAVRPPAGTKLLRERKEASLDHSPLRRYQRGATTELGLDALLRTNDDARLKEAQWTGGIGGETPPQDEGLTGAWQTGDIGEGRPQVQGGQGKEREVRAGGSQGVPGESAAR